MGGCKINHPFRQFVHVMYQYGLLYIYIYIYLHCWLWNILQVNGRRLLGLNHKEVVGILKELPQHVRLVCARHKETENYTDQDKIENGYSTYLQSNYSGVNEVSPITERLVKAKSENTLASTDESVLQQMMKNKSRSLEELTNFKMWSIEPVVIELCKGDKGLGFSILDYKVQLTWAFFHFHIHCPFYSGELKC